MRMRREWFEIFPIHHHEKGHDIEREGIEWYPVEGNGLLGTQSEVARRLLLLVGQLTVHVVHQDVARGDGDHLGTIKLLPVSTKCVKWHRESKQ